MLRQFKKNYVMNAKHEYKKKFLLEFRPAMRLNHCYNLVATHNIVKVILRSNFPVRFFAFQLAGKERREISSFAFSAKVLMRAGIPFRRVICYHV